MRLPKCDEEQSIGVASSHKSPLLTQADVAFCSSLISLGYRLYLYFKIVIFQNRKHGASYLSQTLHTLANLGHTQCRSIEHDFASFSLLFKLVTCVVGMLGYVCIGLRMRQR